MIEVEPSPAARSPKKHPNQKKKKLNETDLNILHLKNISEIITILI